MLALRQSFHIASIIYLMNVTFSWKNASSVSDQAPLERLMHYFMMLEMCEVAVTFYSDKAEMPGRLYEDPS